MNPLQIRLIYEPAVESAEKDAIGTHPLHWKFKILHLEQNTQKTWNFWSKNLDSILKASPHKCILVMLPLSQISLWLQQEISIAVCRGQFVACWLGIRSLPNYDLRFFFSSSVCSELSSHFAAKNPGSAPGIRIRESVIPRVYHSCRPR